jgi:phage pi2 protein 07
MVQFGKTETTTNTTNHNNDYADRKTIHNNTSTDTSDKRQYYTEDKTHKEYFNSKDIFNTVNNYQNVNMSLLAASMALSIVAPIINGLICKAINKWNHEVPPQMQKIANDEYELIHGKCEKLISANNTGVVLYPLAKKDVNSTDFLSLQHRVNDYLRSLLRLAADDIIEGIIKKDAGRIKQGESLLLTVKNPFSTSYQSHVQYTTSPEQIGIFQYDQTIAALNRILPSAMLGDSTSILVRKMVPVHHSNLHEEKLNRMHEVYRNVYEFQEMPRSGPLFNVHLMPISGYADLETVSVLYGIDLTQISNAHFFSSCQNGDSIVTKDDNFSGKAILETKLGHSMAIIGETVNEVADVMMDVLRRMNPNEDIQHSYRRVERGPWASGRCTRQFGNLMSIFEIKDENDIIKLDEDFRTLASLVQIVGTMKKLYPELMPRPDPQMKAFIRRCRIETDRISMPLVPSYASMVASRSGSPHHWGSHSVDFDKRSELRLIGPTAPDAHLVVTDMSGMTTLDLLFMDTNISGDLPQGIIKISELSVEHLTIVQSEFMMSIFTITKDKDSPGHTRCKITLSDSDFIRRDMKGKQMMNSRQYKDQVWHVRGAKLFDKQSKFYNTEFR